MSVRNINHGGLRKSAIIWFNNFHPKYFAKGDN